MIIIVAEIIRTPIKSEQFYSKTLFHFITFMKCADGFPKNSKYQVSDITTNNISLCVPKLFKFGLGLNPFIPICLCSFLSCCFFFKISFQFTLIVSFRNHFMAAILPTSLSFPVSTQSLKTLAT